MLLVTTLLHRYTTFSFHETITTMHSTNLKKLTDTLDIVNILLKTEKQYIGKLLNALSPARINNICELYYNIIVNPDSKNIQYSARRKLKRHFLKSKAQMMDIADSRKSLTLRRKHLVNQTGSGIFTTILSLAVPLITSLLVK